MSSDGSTDKPRPARPGRGDDRGLASIALGVLLILAVVATVVMVFTDNPVWMRIGTLAALWAAFIGAFLVARYRRQAAAEAARVRDLHTVYELQLEREISARREHELVVEKDLRDSIRVETSESVLALRQEIAALREQLTAMGVTLPEDRFAVGGHAPAGQLGAGSLPSVPSERVEPRRRVSEPGDWSSAATVRPSSPSSPSSVPSQAPSPSPVAGVSPGSTPSTERTEKFSAVEERRAGSEAPGFEASGFEGATASPSSSPRRPAVRPVGEASRSSRRSAPSEAPVPPAGPTAEPAAHAAPASSVPTAEPADSPVAPSAPAVPAAAAESSPQAAPASRHGSGSGLSVAELMARLGGDDSGKGGDEAASGGRRRRRAED